MLPRPPPSVFEDTAEASATAMEEEMERICDLQGNSDDDNMAEDGLVPDGTARSGPDRTVHGLPLRHTGIIRHGTMGRRAA